MLISDFAIKRPIVTVVSMLALVVFGLIALFKLQTDEFPDVAPPFVTIGIPYPGAAPDGVEKEILDPVEEAISSISGVKNVMGTAEDGFATIMVEFLFDKPLQEATQDIRDAISGIRQDLPPEMEEPIIKKFNDTDLPIVSLALSSNTLSPGELTRLADPGITRELRSIAGVAEVEVPGKVERELTVQIKPDALQAAGIGVSQLVQALQLQNLAAPVGRVTGDLDERSIRLRGRLERPEDFEQIIVAERNGQVIRLGQVADVLDGTEEARSLALYSDAKTPSSRESVGIDIKKSKGYSTTHVADQLIARIDELEKGLPAGTTIDVIKNRGERVRNSVANVQEALLEGAALTVLVVFLFLNSWRSTVITGLALPVSVLASFVAVWAFGFTLNTMSLLGLSLAIGILIDDAIVVRENIVRHVEMGKDHYTAAREGTDEIGLAVAATTFSIIAVFVPIAFMPGVGGQWFKPFALTMACSVLVSLFVSFSLDPMLSAYWADPHREEHEKAWITRQLDKFNHWFNRQAQNYKRVIAWALDHRAAIAVIAIGTFLGAFTLPTKGIPGLLVVLVGVAAAVFLLGRSRRWYVKLGAVAVGVAIPAMLLGVVPQWMHVGFGFFPEDDQAEINVTVETPPGSNIEYTRLKAEEVARQLRTYPEVRYVYTTIGGGAAGAVDLAKLYVALVPTSERSDGVEALSARFRDDLKPIGGAKIAVFSNDWGGGRKQVQLQIRGNNTAELAKFSELALAEVQKVPGAVDVSLSTKGQKPELTVDLNRGVAGSIGVTVGQVAQALRPAFAGIDAGDWQDPSGEMRDVTVRLAPEARRRAADLRQLPLVIAGPNGVPTTAPLGQVATVRQGVGPAVINHLNRDKVVSVEFNTSGRSMGEVTNDAFNRMLALQPPPGIRVEKGGEAQSQDEVFGQIFLALGVAVGLMYLILVMQFGSFLDPLAIMLSLPLSLIGVMLSLALTNNTINIMSLIGVILLMGIVAKNAILLIDFAKWAREKQGMNLRDALVEAGAIRLRPILMTTVALIAGMLPVALGRGEGAQFRAPLGIAVIGGVITSTLLTLIAIPTFYEILDEWRAALAQRFGMRVKQKTAEYPVPALAPETGD
ncbi:MAG TPA: efflux RND transporter permease subunit [Gemmatimonadaceae bacterium]|nr:efflux RND transporter permease subunit [Gemmatimonadaceae bacterium]